MDVTPLPDAASFLAGPRRCSSATRPAQPPLGIAHQLVDQPDTYPEAFFWLAADSGGVVGAAMRTPPYPASWRLP